MLGKTYEMDSEDPLTNNLKVIVLNLLTADAITSANHCQTGEQ